MSIAPSPESPRSAPASAGRITLVRLDHGCALLVTVAHAVPQLVDRLWAMAPQLVVRGVPLLGVSVATRTSDASEPLSATLPFAEGGAERAVLRLADALSARGRPPT